MAGGPPFSSTAQPNYATPQAAQYQPTAAFSPYGYTPMRQYGYSPYQPMAYNPYQGYNPFQYVGSSPGYGGLSSYMPQYQQMGMYLNNLRFPSFQQPFLAPMGGASASQTVPIGGAQGYAGSGGTLASQTFPANQAGISTQGGWDPAMGNNPWDH